MSSPWSFSAAGGAHLLEGKGPLQRNQALSETFLRLSYKAPPPWHTGALGGRGREGWKFEPSTICRPPPPFSPPCSVTHASQFDQVHWLGGFLLAAIDPLFSDNSRPVTPTESISYITGCRSPIVGKVQGFCSFHRAPEPPYKAEFVTGWPLSCPWTLYSNYGDMDQNAQ